MSAPKLPAYQAVQQVGGCRCANQTPCPLPDHVVTVVGRLYPNWPQKLCLSCLSSIRANLLDGGEA